MYLKTHLAWRLLFFNYHLACLFWIFVIAVKCCLARGSEFVLFPFNKLPNANRNDGNTFAKQRSAHTEERSPQPGDIGVQEFVCALAVVQLPEQATRVGERLSRDKFGHHAADQGRRFRGIHEAFAVEEGTASQTAFHIADEGATPVDLHDTAVLPIAGNLPFYTCAYGH